MLWYSIYALVLHISTEIKFDQGSSSSTGTTWLSILSIFILCVAPARFLNRDKKSGGRVCYNIIIPCYTIEAVTQNEAENFCKCTCAATLLSQFVMDCFKKVLFFYLPEDSSLNRVK